MLKIWLAKLKIANKELKGIRIILAKLILSVIALFFSFLGIIFLLIGWNNWGLITILFGNLMISLAIALPAIKTLKTVGPIFSRQMR